MVSQSCALVRAALCVLCDEEGSLWFMEFKRWPLFNVQCSWRKHSGQFVQKVHSFKPRDVTCGTEKKLEERRLLIDLISKQTTNIDHMNICVCMNTENCTGLLSWTKRIQDLCDKLKFTWRIYIYMLIEVLILQDAN